MSACTRGVRTALRNRYLRQGGFAVPELAVAIAVSGIIAAAALTFVVVSSRQYEGQQDRVYATDKARNALMEMTSELRDAPHVQFVDARTVDATVRNADGSTSEVRFSCSPSGDVTGLHRCSRIDLETGEERLIASGVANQDNFSTVGGSDLAGTASLGGALRIDLDIDLSDVTRPENPINLVATVKPRNCVTGAATGVLNPTC
jgi:prepilin-type N-terminal cleavage/methylation domain-containing protein